MIVFVDDVSAIFLSENSLVSQRMKHIDVHYHFVHEYIEDRILKLMFINSKEKRADILEEKHMRSVWRVSW